MVNKNIILIITLIVALSISVSAEYWDNPTTYCSIDEFNETNIDGIWLGTNPSWSVVSQDYLLANNDGGGASAVYLSNSTVINRCPNATLADTNMKGVNFTLELLQQLDSNGNFVAIVISENLAYEQSKSYNELGAPIWTFEGAGNNSVRHNVSVYWYGNTYDLYYDGVFQGTQGGFTLSSYYIRFDHQASGGAPSKYNIYWIRAQIPAEEAPVIDTNISVSWEGLTPLNETHISENLSFYYNISTAGNEVINCSLFNEDEGFIGAVTNFNLGENTNSITYNVTSGIITQNSSILSESGWASPSNAYDNDWGTFASVGDTFAGMHQTWTIPTTITNLSIMTKIGFPDTNFQSAILISLFNHTSGTWVQIGNVTGSSLLTTNVTFSVVEGFDDYIRNSEINTSIETVDVGLEGAYLYETQILHDSSGLKNFWIECYDNESNTVNTTLKTIIIDTIIGNVEWGTPTNDNTTVFSIGSSAFNITYSDQYLNTTNTTCWLNGGNIFFNNFTDGINGATPFVFANTITLNDEGNYVCEAYLSDGLNNVTEYAEFNVTDDRDVIGYLESVTTTQYQTKTYYYENNITFNAGLFNVTGVSLNITNETYPLTIETINTTTIRAYATIYTPLEWNRDGGTIPYNWNITLAYANGTEVINNTIGGSITQNDFNMSTCTSGRVAFEFIFADEVNQSRMNAATAIGSYIQYTFDSQRRQYETITFSDITENPNYAFCTDATNQEEIYSFIHIGYSANGYQQRLYEANLVGNETNPSNNTLYLLQTSAGIYTTFQVQNVAQEPLEAVTVTMEKQISSVYTIIEQKDTDAAGGVTFWVDPNSPYRFTFEKSGYADFQTTLNPTQSAYTITMETLSNVTSENLNEGISFIVLPEKLTLNNDTTYNFNFTINSSFFILQSAGFNLSNSTGALLGNVTCIGDTTGCIATLDLNTGSNEDIIMDYFWEVNSTFVMGQARWQVASVIEGQYSIMHFIRNLRNLRRYFPNDTSFYFTTTLITLLIILISIGILSYSNLSAPIPIAIVVFAEVALADYAGFIPNIVSLTTGFQIPYVTTTLVGIFLLMYVISEQIGGKY